ncbi:MAG TPA: immunoglobulin domain-containing protein [Candidatus Limnocylindria bacterium]|nr:immunoglobulin domain-containing protein [Candidatus Limnocylindria bacterium]
MRVLALFLSLWSIVLATKGGSSSPPNFGVPVAWGNYAFADYPDDFTNLVAIKAAGNYCIALKSDGTAYSWGIGGGLARMSSNVVSIAAGARELHATRDDGILLVAGGFPEDPILLASTIPDWLTNVVQSSSGPTHSLALTSDGYLVAWGLDQCGLLEPPLDILFPRAIAAGAHASVVIRSNGSLAGWGCNDYGILSFPAALKEPIQIAMGPNDTVVALDRSGTVYAWGDNSEGQSAIPPGLTNVVEVAAGSHHHLALRNDGSLVAWGASGSPLVRPPTNIPTLFAIAAGDNFGIGLTRAPIAKGQEKTIQVPAGADFTVPKLILSAAPCTYAWTKTGISIPDATNEFLSFENFGHLDEGTYRLTASNEFGHVESSRLNLIMVDRSPVIALPPKSQAVLAGGTAEFSVDARGSGPIWYQWQFNGENIKGATSSALILTNVSQINDGEYAVIVSNGLGWTKSPIVELSTGLPRFVRQPASRRLLPNQPYEMYAEVLTPEPPVWQWLHNGQLLAGATSSSLQWSRVNSLHTGDYTVVASNSYGASTSRAAFLNVRQFPEPSPEPATVVSWGIADLTPTVPESLTNVVAVAAGNGFALGLRSNGTVTTWAESSLANPEELLPPPELDHVVSIAAGRNHWLALRADGTVVVVSRKGSFDQGESDVPSGLTNVVEIAAGWIFSIALKSDGTAVVWPPNRPDLFPSRKMDGVVAIAAKESASVFQYNDGTIHMFNSWVGELAFHEDEVTKIGSDGSTALLLWRNLSVARVHYNSTLYLKDVYDGFSDMDGSNGFQAFINQDHTVVETGWGVDGLKAIPIHLEQASRVALGYGRRLALTPAPHIYSEPVSITTNTRVPVSFTAQARSSSALRYQWLHDGAVIAGETNATLRLPPTRFSDAGEYSVVVSNDRYSITSSAAQLTLDGVPEIEALPDITSLAGTDIELHSSIFSPATFTLQWFHDDSPLTGSTNENLVLHDLQAGDAGNYRVAASNQFGITYGEPARVTVVPTEPQAEITSLDEMPVVEGAHFSLSATATGTEPFTYQWFHGETAIPGATNAIFSRNNLVVEDSGDYRVLVANAVGTTRLTSPVVVVKSKPVFGPTRNWQLANGGSTTTLRASWAGTSPIHLQWAKDGNVLAAQTNSELTLTRITTNDAGSYVLEAINDLGTGHSQAIELKILPSRGAGMAVGWGSVSVPPMSTLVQQVSAGNGYGLALTTDDTIMGFGTNTTGALNIPDNLTNVVSIAAGSTFALALRNDGTVRAWGENTWGQSTVPTDLSHVVAIAAGNFHALALRDDGKIVRWGSSQSGETSVSQKLTNIISIRVRDSANIALRADGEVIEWGSSAPIFFQPKLPTNLVELAIGPNFAVALKDNGEIIRWGSFNTPPAFTNGILSISAGRAHVLAVRTDGTVFGWGSNLKGDLTIPGGLNNVLSVAAGDNFSLAIIRSIGITSLSPPVTLNSGGSTTLRVQVTGGHPLSFQWYKGTVPLPNQTNSFLDLSVVTVSDAGDYHVRISNPWQTVESSPIPVKVMGPVELLLLGSNSDRLQFHIHVPGAPSTVVQKSLDFTNWSPWKLIFLPPDGTNISFPMEPNEPRSFYRLWISF